MFSLNHFILLSVLSFLVSCSQLKTNKQNCDDINSCLDLAASLTYKQYVIAAEKVSGPVKTYGELKWTKDNADSLIGELLHDSGYARIQTSDQNVYQIINARDIRYTAHIPTFQASKASSDQLPPPNSADWGELIYKTTVTQTNRASSIARNLRPFMSRYGRVIDDPIAGIVIVRDHLANIHQVLPIIRKLDVDVTKDEIKMHERNYQLEVLREKTRQEMLKKMEELTKQKAPDKKE